MPFLVVLTSCVLIGVLAQTLKKRTGVLWGFLAFCATFPIWIFFAFAAAVTAPELFQGKDAAYTPYSVALLSSLAGGGIMVLIVLALPAISKCHHCAESIRRAAKVCKHCTRPLSA